MTIRVHIEHDGQSLDRTFDDTVALAAFLSIAAYYVERRGVEAMFKRFRKTGVSDAVSEEAVA